jgi:LacI family transcriptional regulator
VNRKKSPLTIRDVAREAGVSVSTVSRVLNDKDDVSSDTYSKVQTIIQQLGYASSLAAKGMRSRRTNVIGLVVPDVSDSFTIQVMKGVNRAIQELGQDLIVYTGGRSALSLWPVREQQYVNLLNGSITDGIIVVAPTATTFSTVHPLVAVDPHPETTEFPAVIATNRVGALALMEYLIKLGHRRIGFISGRTDLQSALRRFQGYKDGLCQAQLAFEPELIQPGDFTHECGYAGAQRLLSLAEPPTAIFAANDRSAIGVIHAAQALGVRVPEELSVVGFDNIPEAAYIGGGLTTVDQFIDKMGYLAVQMLYDLLENKPIEQYLHRVDTQLIIRNSCQPVSLN